MKYFSTPLIQKSAIFLLFLVFLTWSLYFFLVHHLSTQAQYLASLVDYSQGGWDISKYQSHPQPIKVDSYYLITRDGYVIDRVNPIPGLLNTAEFNFASSFTKPQTITTPTGQPWRLYSNTVIINNQLVGTVQAGYPFPETNSTAQIDEFLTRSAKAISSQLRLADDQLLTESINVDSVHPKVELIIVDRYNHIIYSRGNPPTYLSTSLLEPYTHLSTQIISSGLSQTHLLHALPVTSNSQTVGFVLTASQISPLTGLLFSSRYLLLLLLTLIAIGFFITTKHPNPSQSKPPQIQFHPRTGQLIMEDRKLKLPFDTNQYYLARAIFKRPQHRYTYDELAEIIHGDDSFGAARKHKKSIYDAARLLNQKTNRKFNQDLVSINTKTLSLTQPPANTRKS